MRDLPAFEHEPMMPFESESLPKVVLATVPDWYAKSRWFYEVNAKQFEPTPEIRAKVNELVRGVASRDQKLAILTRWVANNVRYRGFSMGRTEGYVLHTGAQVFEERAGVCKDIASMLVTMARAAGFTVYPAMTMAGARVEDEPADQFNHSVVAVKNDDGTFTMLDPTWAPLDRYVWSPAESEQHYVIGTPQGRRLEMIPASKPEDNQLRFVVSTKYKDPKTLLLRSMI
jgi:transglutaminase-like putative cysteine protease